MVEIKLKNMDLIKEAFIEGYKQRAEGSNLIFDDASRIYAIHLFDRWKTKQVCDCMPDPTCRVENNKILCNGCNKERK
jgi:hypothetical protein